MHGEREREQVVGLRGVAFIDEDIAHAVQCGGEVVIVRCIGADPQTDRVDQERRGEIVVGLLCIGGAETTHDDGAAQIVGRKRLGRRQRAGVGIDGGLRVADRR